MLNVSPGISTSRGRNSSIMSATERVRSDFGVVSTRTVARLADSSGPTVVASVSTSGSSRSITSTSEVTRSVSASDVPAGSSRLTENVPWSPRALNSCPMSDVSPRLPTNARNAPSATVLRWCSDQRSTPTYVRSIASSIRTIGPYAQWRRCFSW
jgi:hypothetical protein